MDISNLGEQLLPGQLGNAAVILGFVAACLALLSFVRSLHAGNAAESRNWNRLGRQAFLVQALLVAGVILLLYYLIFSHLYEYDYVRRHSSDDMPVGYLISCFWAGQQGSFLLWLFWNSVLGLIVAWKMDRAWSPAVLAVVSLIQAVLLSMILGVGRVGVSPFELSQEQFSANPTFLLSDYAQLLSGRGLNPLLENYWMVIHPPTLFLGFSATLIPFALTIAGLWKNDLKGWTRPALPWTIFACMILGVGIMMGGAWAYESLSFGGFWAWDPVENASFVPLLTLLAGMHSLVAYRASGHGLRITFVLLMCSFFLILYSTFLTRSGILGDTSVHSFTDLGMMGQLLLLILLMMLPAVGLLMFRWKKIPHPKKEESAYSKEFWMFVGALVLLLSAIQITFHTSIPVWNSLNAGVNRLVGGDILPANLAPPQDAVSFYNGIQIWFGILIAALSATVQFLHYRRQRLAKTFRWLAPALVLAIVITWLVQRSLHMSPFTYPALLFCGLFAAFANTLFLIRILKGKIRLSGSAIAHTGFGLVMVGVIIALGNQTVISRNYMGVDYGSQFEASFNRNNILLSLDKTVQMGDFLVRYEGREQEGRDFYYTVSYRQLDSLGGNRDSFVLKPHLLVHPDMGLVTNPDTRHFWNKDVFTHVTSIPNNSEKRPVDELQRSTHELFPGDTAFTGNGLLIFDGFRPSAEGEQTMVTTTLHLSNFDTSYVLHPKFIIVGTQVLLEPAEIPDLPFRVALTRINPQTGAFTFSVEERQDWIIMKAIVFPFINLLWLGIVMSILGFLISFIRRRQEYRSSRNSILVDEW